MNKEDVTIARNVVRKYESQNISKVTKLWFKILLWLFVCIGIFILLQLKQSGIIGDIVVIVASAFIGAAVCFTFITESGDKTWNVIKPYLNVHELKKVIGEEVT